MAQEFIASEVLVLEANTGTTASKIWTKLVCLTEKNFNGTTASVDIVTDCNEDFSSPQPGKKSWTIGYGGYANKSPEANEGSYETVYDLWDAKTVTEFRIRNADNTYYREGRGFISDVSEPSSAGDYLQFSGTITGNGPIVTTPTS